MDLPQLVVTAGVGALAAALNSVAGGGTLISFPYLTLGLGLPALQANATNTVSLWPGSLAGGLGFGDHIETTKKHFWRLLAPTALGSAVGAALLLHTSKVVFNWLVPVLIALASLALFLQPQVKALAASRHGGPHPVAGVATQALVAVYGGYFGAGMGMMMLGSFAVTMDADIHSMNAVKNWLGTVINLVAAGVFLASGIVSLPVALTLTVGSVAGGFLGAKLSQRFDSEKLRLVICAYGSLMAAFYAYRAATGA